MKSLLFSTKKLSLEGLSLFSSRPYGQQPVAKPTLKLTIKWDTKFPSVLDHKLVPYTLSKPTVQHGQDEMFQFLRKFLPLK